MTSEQPPQELLERLPHDPRLWVRNFLRHPNDAAREYDFYDTSKQNFLYYLADDDGPMNPENWGDINVLLFCRGGLKTFTTVGIAGWGLDTYTSLEAVATAPVNDQRAEVIDRFKEKAEQCGLADRRVKNNQGHQKFKNTAIDPETGDEYTAYSHLKSRSAWDEGNKLRGLHAHVGVVDEAQDVDEGMFSTFLEAIDREVPQVDYFPTIFVIGTPKMANTFFHKLWQYSDQKTWDADEREWQQGDEAQEFLPVEMAERREELEEKIEQLEDIGGDDALIEHFRNELSDLQGFTVQGWHVDQQNCPLHDNTDIEFKRETYSKRKFQNEVLAKFYTPESDLLTDDDIWRSLTDELGFRTEPLHDESEIYMGVDWGGGDGEGASKTATVVLEQEPDGELMTVLNLRLLDADLTKMQEVEEVEAMIRSYDVDVCVVDEGYGDTNRSNLQDGEGTVSERGYPKTVFGCRYGNVKAKEEIKWNRFKNQKRFFTVDRTYMIKNFVQDVKDGNVRIPKSDMSFVGQHDLGTKVVDELTAPYTDRIETSGGRRKEKVLSDRRDDIFHAFTFAWIAANEVSSVRTLKSITANNRRGY